MPFPRAAFPLDSGGIGGEPSRRGVRIELNATIRPVTRLLQEAPGFLRAQLPRRSFRFV